MKAEKNRVVGIAYQLRTEPQGEIMDSAEEAAPFEFLFGHNNVLELFEANLSGLEAGKEFSFTLSPEQGYGEYETEAVIRLGKEVFTLDGESQEDMIFLGNMIPLQDQEGNPFQGRIIDIQQDTVDVDLNHPFAGKFLHFSGKVIHVREAHPIEIEHGHVHSGGNHHHH